MAKLYVGNVGPNFTDAQLTELFSGYGALKLAIIVKSEKTGKSLGYAMVEMDDELAMDALDALNGYDIGGRKLTLSVIKT